MNTQPRQNARDNNYDGKPEFSPDGKTVALASFNRRGVQGGIYLMGARGTAIHLIIATALGGSDPGLGAGRSIDRPLGGSGPCLRA